MAASLNTGATLRVTPKIGLNIRTGPGTNYSKKSAAYYGDTLTYQGQTSGSTYGGWYYIKWNRTGVVGWVASCYTSVLTNPSNSTPSPAPAPTPAPAPAPTPAPPPPASYDEGKSDLFKRDDFFMYPHKNPEYQKAFFEVLTTYSDSGSKNSGGGAVYKRTRYKVPFYMAPEGFTETRSNQVNIVKTIGGQFIYRQGPNPVQLQISGVFADSLHFQERNEFISKFIEEMCVDKVDSKYSRYYNDNQVSLHIEGWKYDGVITNITVQKQAMQNPYLYQYNIAMVAVKTKLEAQAPNKSPAAQIKNSKNMAAIHGILSQNYSPSGFKSKSMANALKTRNR